MSKTETQANETQQEKNIFEIGVELYDSKAPFEEVIPVFEQAVKEYPKDSAGWTCLAWLRLLRNEGTDAEQAFEEAKKASRMDHANAQAHFNMILAMLIMGKTGVRGELNKAMQKCTPDDFKEVLGNLNDALERRPDFSEAKKLLGWIDPDSLKGDS